MAFGQRLELISFETNHACAPYEPPKEQALAYGVFSHSLTTLPEKSLVPMSVLGASYFYDFKSESATGISLAISREYKSLEEDPLFKGLESSLSYSFSTKKPASGRLYLYSPATVDEHTNLIVFTHGFGGCFKFYLKFMVDAFPDAIIVFPVFGHSGGLISPEYLRDMWVHVAKSYVLSDFDKFYVGLSAGGYSLFRLYPAISKRFSGAISLASYCPPEHLPLLNSEMKLLMLNGNKEQGLTREFLLENASKIEKRVSHFQIEFIEGSHFFMIESREQTISHLRTFVNQGRKKTGNPQRP